MVVSAPSGAGKTTLCDRLVAACEQIHYSISCTTRAPRQGEVDGHDYHFLDQDAFNKRIEKNEFIEYARVHGNWYGTLRRTVVDQLAAGKDVLMDIDVQGAAQIREYVRHASESDLIQRGFVDIFIAPPSMEVLHVRLNGRGTDDAEVVRKRMINAEQEMRHWREYKYLVVNDNLEQAAAAMQAILLAEHRLIWRT